MKHLVIGYLGSVGERHYRLLQKAGEEVIGIDKPSVNPETMYIPSYNDFDMVWVCTPEEFKKGYVEGALAQGKKVFVEKPYGIQHEGQIWVACNYRFHPAVKVLKDNLDRVGKILYSRMHFSHYLPYQRENWQEYMKDTNIIMDAGWHFVDLALWLFGKGYEYNNRICHIKELNIKDICRINLWHEIDCETFIDLDYLRRDKSWGIEVVGTEGTLYLLSQYKIRPIITVDFIKDREDATYTLYMATDKPDEMYRNQLNYLLKEDWKSNIAEALEVMKICG